MSYITKLAELETLRNSKSQEFDKVFEHYSIKGQQDISFREVSQLKDELYELEALISVVKSIMD